MKTRRAWLGLSPQYLQLFFATTAHLSLKGSLLEHTHLLLFSSRSTSMCCKAKLLQCPCLAPRLVPAGCLRVCQEQSPPWGSEGGGRAQETRHREGRAGFDLPTSARSNSTPLLQEEVSACRPNPLQT